jgi:hypothetical protein
LKRGIEKTRRGAKGDKARKTWPGKIFNKVENSAQRINLLKKNMEYLHPSSWEDA